jgi:hypothetical protein
VHALPCLPRPAGNRLWEWFSVGRWGTQGYIFKEQRFGGEEWPEALGERQRCLCLPLLPLSLLPLQLLMSDSQCLPVAQDRFSVLYPEPTANRCNHLSTCLLTSRCLACPATRARAPSAQAPTSVPPPCRFRRSATTFQSRS